jgi:SAM-dependent methyltransferase
MILAEHRYRPITGTIVTLGRNSVGLTDEQMDRLLASMDVPKRDVPYEFDTDTMGAGGQRISQESFFAAFTDARVTSLDVSDYEKAEIICDIQDELPAKFVGVADFVYDGGSLDNIFDVAATLRNLSRLLKPGGRLIATNNGGPHPTAYLKYSADWFMDFFTINEYADCKTYICNYPDTLGMQLKTKGKQQNFTSPYQIVAYAFNPYVTHRHGEGYDCSSIESINRYQIFVFAEKGPKSTDHRNPIQKHYRVDPEHNRICNESAKRFLHSPRPVFANPTPFNPEEIPRIDSSDYPEQIRPVAVLSRDYVRFIKTGKEPKMTGQEPMQTMTGQGPKRTVAQVAERRGWWRSLLPRSKSRTVH